MDAKDIELMESVCAFFVEFDSFFNMAKSELKPVLDEVWEHYHNTDDCHQEAHSLMLGMSLKHDGGYNWTLFDVINALQYVKLFMRE